MKKESGVRESSEVVLLLFLKQQQLPTTWVRRSWRLDERLNILRIPLLCLFLKKKHEPFTLQFARFGGSRLYLSQQQQQKE